MTNETKILVVDIETAGTNPQDGSILEIGIASFDIKTLEIEKVFSSLMREKILTAKHRFPPYDWIFENSSLTIEAVRIAVEGEKVLSEVQKILFKYPLGATAYNKQFDFGFLKSRGLIINELPCVMLLCTPVCKIKNQYGYSSYKWPKVEEAYKFFFPESSYKEEHRALDDAIHEAEILRELYIHGFYDIKYSHKKITEEF